MKNLNNTKQLTQLLQILVKLQEIVPNIDCGICTNIAIIDENDIIPTSENSLRRLYQDWIGANAIRWDKFSGNIVYPVPSVDITQSPSSYYWVTKSKWSGEYGELRKEFLQWSIAEITKEIEENENESK